MPCRPCQWVGAKFLRLSQTHNVPDNYQRGQKEGRADSSPHKQPSPERIGAGNESSSVDTSTTSLVRGSVLPIHPPEECPEEDGQRASERGDDCSDVVAVHGNPYRPVDGKDRFEGVPDSR